MSLTFEQIVLTAYKDQFEAGQIELSDNGEGIYISQWNVPDVYQPSYEEIMALDSPALERLFELYRLQNQASNSIQKHIDLTAMKKSYANGTSCCSYYNSQNQVWAAEGAIFTAWRDSVWEYAYNLLADYENNAQDLPSIQSIMDGLPVIQWP